MFGGPVVKAWLFYNAIIYLESILPSLKSATILPIYKGKGKDHLDPNNYRGNSLPSKVFEIIVLRRLLPVLEDLHIPHLNQTAYQQDISIHDATFATQETIRKYVRDGEIVYQLFL